MPRRKSVPKRQVVPDSKYGDVVVSQFVNALMGRGKKSVAEKILYSAIESAEKRSGEEAGLEVFHKALNNVKPALEVKSRRVGGATYQVPVEVRPRRRSALAMRWISMPRGLALRNQWGSVGRRSLWWPPRMRAPRSKSEKTPTGWRKLTRRLRISAGRLRVRTFLKRV